MFDSLRALAALGVLGFHAAGFDRMAHVPELVQPFAAHLDVGVTVFFVISGFLLYRPFTDAHRRRERVPPPAAYLRRRIVRVAPAYWVALTVAIAWLGSERILRGHDPLTYYAYAQSFSAETITHGLTQAWSLVIEVGFYLLLPVLALGLRALPGSSPRAWLGVEAVTLAALAVASLAFKVWYLADHSATAAESLPWMLSLPAYLDQLAAGMALAVASVWAQHDAPAAMRERLGALAPWGWGIAALAFAVLAVGIGLEALGTAPTREQALGRHLLSIAVGVGLLAPAVFGDPGKGLVRRVLATRVLLAVGVVSYGVYLYHLPVLAQVVRWPLDGVDESLRPWLRAGAGLALTAGLAAASYLIVERPTVRFDRFARARLRGRAAPGSAEPKTTSVDRVHEEAGVQSEPSVTYSQR